MKMESDALSDKFTNILETLNAFKKTVSTLQSEIKVLEKTVNKEIRASKKKRNNDKKKKPSGFAKPTKISDELCEFMNKEKGAQVARTEVTQYIINYIKDNDLQFVENKKVIVPDNSLKRLLRINDEELTYFNIQKYMNKHFIN